MSRYTGPKNRIARRFKVNIFGRARNPLLHKTNPPGMHGAKRQKKSDYGELLDEKQKLKAVYGMLTEKQLINAYRKAIELKGNTAQILLSGLECRLDNLVYRLKFASTIFAAQQLVTHRHITVNGKIVDIRSFKVTPGMVIAVKEKSRNVKAVKESVDNGSRSVPGYLELSGDKFSGKLLAQPEMDQISLPITINIPLVCELLAQKS